MGNIGSQVAKMAAYGLHMKVIGYNRHISGIRETEFGRLTGDLQEVISSADFLSLHLPGDKSTRHMIGEKELSWMKPDAFLINTGRGEVVDESALIKLLQEKKERMAYQAALGIAEVLENRPVTYAVNRIHNNFEENKSIEAVMNFYRYEFPQHY